jgi:hypothetical protein
MANAAELAILIRAKDEASRVFKEVDRNAHNLQKSIGAGLKQAALIGAAGLAAGALAVANFVKAAAAEQVGVARLQASIKTLSQEQQRNAAGVEELVRQRERLAFSDDVIRDSLSILINQTGSYTEAVNRQRIAMDVARATGMELQLASRLVGKITDESTTAFKKYGISLRAGATEQEALAEIQRRFAGQSEAYAGTATAKWEIFNNALNNIKESLGGALLPVVTRVGTAVGDFFTRHQADIDKFSAVLAVELPRAFNAIEAGARRAFEVFAPMFAALDTKDAVFALGAVAAAFIAIAVAAGVAFIATNAALFGIPILIAAIVVAITLLVRHWDAAWGAMKATPAAILDWLKTHWADVLVFILAGPLGVIIKNWDAIFGAMPRPVQVAMNAIAGFVETMVNGVLAGVRKVAEAIDSFTGALAGVGGKVLGAFGLGGISGTNLAALLPGDVNFTNRMSAGRGAGGMGFAVDPVEIWKNAAAAVDGASVAAIGLEESLGGAGGGGAAGAVDEAAESLRQLAVLYGQWAAATGGTLPQFIARLEMMQRESELNAQLADAQMRASIEAEKATDANYGLRIALKELALEALNSGRTLNEVSRDAFAKLVDNLRQAFGGLFGRPTREQAELDLRLALLEEKRARMKIAGAAEEELERIDRKIERLRDEDTLLSRHADVLRAQLEVADQTLITEQHRDIAAQMFIAAMYEQSAQLATLTAMAGLEAIAREHLISAINNQANAYGSAVSAADPFDALQKAYINAVARGKNEPEPFPGYEHGTNYVRRTGLAVVHEGEEITSAADNRRDAGGARVFNNYGTISLPNVREPQDFARELDRYFRQGA